MEDVWAALSNLKRAIETSDEYAAYLKSKRRLENNPVLFDELAGYKKKNCGYTFSVMDGSQESFDFEKHLGDVYWGLKRDATAGAFIDAEKNLVDLLDRIYNEIMSSVSDLNMFFE